MVLNNTIIKKGLAMKGLLLFTVLILAVTVSVACGLTLLDNVVRGTLYDHGLQFSYDWATLYWTILRTIQALVGLTAAFTLASTIYIYRKYVHAKPEMKTTVSEKLVSPFLATKPQTRSLSGSIKCTHCGKVFSQPLQMLDFQSDNNRIINICPFCNEVIQPVSHQEQSQKVKKTVWKEKENIQPKVMPKSQETRQEQTAEETNETVTTQAP